jgi:hypothetical protein
VGGCAANHDEHLPCGERSENFHFVSNVVLWPAGQLAS